VFFATPGQSPCSCSQLVKRAGVGAKAEDGGASRCSGPAGAPGTVKAPFHAPACSSSRENGGVVKCGGAPR
jgi:hypothetical protein